EASILQMFSSSNRPTAIFDGSGDLVVQIYRAVQQLGLSIPRDVSVVTFDDAVTDTSFLEPQITQLTHSWNYLGRAALDILLSEVNLRPQKGIDETKEHRVVDFSWIEGASLAAPLHEGK